MGRQSQRVKDTLEPGLAPTRARSATSPGSTTSQAAARSPIRLEHLYSKAAAVARLVRRFLRLGLIFLPRGATRLVAAHPPRRMQVGMPSHRRHGSRPRRRITR